MFFSGLIDIFDVLEPPPKEFVMALSLTTLSVALAAIAQVASQASGPIIQVDPTQKYQTYDGIGVSEAFQRSLVLHELNTDSQKLALDYLFSNTTGAGFTILRNGLGSSPDDPFDLMKSIAPSAPSSNNSKVISALDALCS